MTRRPLLAAIIAAVVLCGCSKDSGSLTPPSPPVAPAPPTAVLTATFDQNPVPFRSAGCSFSMPQGWYAQARIAETAGVAFTPATLTQKLDGATVGFLNESFGSRFGACSGTAFTPGVISGSGAVCATVGVCTASSFATYQFSITGSDANGHALTVDSPMLQLGARPAGQTSSAESSRDAMGGAPSLEAWLAALRGQMSLKEQ